MKPHARQASAATYGAADELIPNSTAAATLTTSAAVASEATPGRNLDMAFLRIRAAFFYIVRMENTADPGEGDPTQGPTAAINRPSAGYRR